jgi:hypothetical protein
LFSPESDLLITMLAFASAIDQFLEGDLFALFPGMRKYRIRRYFIVVNDVGSVRLNSPALLLSKRCIIRSDRILRTQMKARRKADARTPQIQ